MPAKTTTAGGGTRGTRTGPGRGTWRGLLLRGGASWRRREKGISLSRLPWGCQPRPPQLERGSLMPDCSTRARVWTLGSMMMRTMGCMTNLGGRRATWPTTSTDPARILMRRCMGGRRIWRLSGPAGVAQSSFRRRWMILSVWMLSWTMQRRQARGAMTMETGGRMTGMGEGVVEIGRGRRTMTKTVLQSTENSRIIIYIFSYQLFNFPASRYNNH